MPPDEVAVRPLTERHWLEVREIYARGIATGNATFDDQPPAWEQFQPGKLAEHRQENSGKRSTASGPAGASQDQGLLIAHRREQVLAEDGRLIPTGASWNAQSPSKRTRSAAAMTPLSRWSICSVSPG